MEHGCVCRHRDLEQDRKDKMRAAQKEKAQMVYKVSLCTRALGVGERRGNACYAEWEIWMMHWVGRWLDGWMDERRRVVVVVCAAVAAGSLCEQGVGLPDDAPAVHATQTG